MFNPDDYKLDIDCMAFPNDQIKWFFRCVVGSMPIDSKRTYTTDTGAYKAGEKWLRKHVYKPGRPTFSNLTKQQQRVLDFIHSYHDSNGFPPTRQEIADKFGVRPNAAQSSVQQLERRGAIKLIANTSRGIVLL